MRNLQSKRKTRWYVSPKRVKPSLRKPSFLLSVLLLSPVSTYAQSPKNPAISADDPIVSSPNVPDPKQPYFSQGPSRWFASSRVLVGLGYGRLSVNTGYGKPHFVWIGPEIEGAISPEFSIIQGGARISAVLLDLQLALRHTVPFARGQVPLARSVNSKQLNDSEQRLPYDTLDATLSGIIPYRPLLVCWEATYVRPLEMNSHVLMYEEMQRIVVGSRGLVTTKLAPMLEVLTENRLYVGFMAEHLSLLGRDEPLVVRLGPTFWSQLTNHLELGSYLTWAIKSADALSFFDGTYGTVALVYKFATGDKWSHFP